jgi:formylmethanofuran dehydrogenase subunit E
MKIIGGDAIKIRSYTFEEYIELVRSFHGYAAPGVVIGGFMVELAYQHLPKEGLFDAICETDKCLPDAVQLLTPCTIGNGWLRVMNIGRFALILYDKHSGKGIRVFLDPLKLDAWSEIKSWFFQQKAKEEQDSQLLMEQIKEAGANILSVRQVKVDIRLLNNEHRVGSAICPICQEAYPPADGEICLGCQGKIPYVVF